MKREISYILIIFLFISLFVFPEELKAAPYYAGKKISIIVGYGPGGGHDRIARLLAKYLPKYIPGKPTIIVENMPGAGSIIAGNRIYNLAKPDGLTFGTFGKGFAFAQLTKVEGVKYDITKYSWIGSAAIEGTVLCLRPDLPFKTFEDLRRSKIQLNIGGTGPVESSWQFCIFLKEFLGINLKMITYPSGSDVMLAVERKEVDGRAGSYGSFKPFIERGLVRPIIRGRVSEAEIENLPVDEDFTTDKMVKTIMAMRSTGDLMGRPYVAPPKTPAEVMAILRDAFAKAAKDRELQEEAKKFMLEVKYITANECMKALNYVFAQPEEIVKEFSKYVKF